jgi:tetratricopeptide (TPR) repeat protein
MTYADVGNIRDALRYLGMAVSLEPNNASYYYNLAVVSDRAGEVKQAIKFYEEALDKDSLYGGGRSVPRDAIYDRLSVIRDRS